jgi:hypothetical protein
VLIKTFFFKNLGEVKIKRLKLFEPEGRVWNHRERALDSSKNFSEPAKNDFGNSPLKIEGCYFI